MLPSQLHFSNFLTTQHINQVKSSYGFQNGVPIEKFIMDFEAFFHIKDYIPNSIVKGGMSVPFHLPDNTARRLSVDIDIVTSMSEDQVKEAMQKVHGRLDGAVIIGENYKPHAPRKNLNLLTYHPKFESCLGGQGEVKVEITYGFTESIPVKEVTNSIDLFACNIDFPFKTYNIGSLIGDKITTLGFNTIGIGEDRADERPKQIYDVATLTKHVTRKEDFEDLVDGFHKISQYEMSVFENDFTNTKIIDDVLESMDGLLTNSSGYHLADDYSPRHETFRAQLLRQNRYLKADHLTDILIVKYLVRKIKELSEGSLTRQNFAQECFTDILEFKRIMGLTGDSKRAEHNKIKAKHSINGSNHMPIIKSLTAEQSFLYDKIIS